METSPVITPDLAEALHIVKNILGNFIDPERIQYGNSKTYSSIVLDGSNQKTICRLYFKHNISIGTFNGRRVETRFQISKISDIRFFSADLMAVLKKYAAM